MAGFKLWGFKEKLTSDDVNSYLMGQSVARFDSTGERTAAITSPETNQLAYVAGIGLTRFNGTDWVVMIAETATSTLMTMTNFTSFYSHWANYGTYVPARYGKDAAGVVHVEGMLRAGTPTPLGDYALVLPAGYRPAQPQIFACAGRFQGTEGIVRCTVSANGQIEPTTARGLSGNFTVTSDWWSLSGISFRAA